MEPEYIIVQAGGKGTRMEHLTANKPKALVPINNLPMLFHLFRKYPDKRFVIIGDYKYDVMKKYLAAFAKVKYLLVDARGKSGTCAGISDAIRIIPEGQAFMLIWSDLVLPDSFSFPEKEGNYVGLSGDFRCRWKYENGEYMEEPSVEYGVAGLFIFKDKSTILNVPEEGEFVKWLKDVDYDADTLTLSKTKEYGLISEYNKLKTSRCRPFNSMRIEGDKLIKTGIDEQGRTLAVREKAWYKFVETLGFKATPKIYSYEPDLVMENIDGKNIYEYKDEPIEKKKEIVNSIVDELKYLHTLGSAEVDYYSMKDAYLTKTLKRLDQVRNLIPFADKEYITVNGRKCKNVYFMRDEFEEMLDSLDCKEFKLLHGDCTFSNMMLRNDKEPVLIDPRGYFGYTENYGDPAYDWAKLYYSLVGNFDTFNNKEFRLKINDGNGREGMNEYADSDVILTIESNGFEELEDYYLDLVKDEVSRDDLRLIHAVIWLSLTTYAWQDYDSICGAFYNGIYYLSEVEK